MVWLVDTGKPLLIILSFAVLMVIYGMMYGPVAAFFSELFETRVRYSGISLGYNLGGIVGGAFTPIIATAARLDGSLVVDLALRRRPCRHLPVLSLPPL